MPFEFWLLLAAFLGVLLLTVKPVGAYLAGLLDGSGRVVKLGKKAENLTLRLIGSDADSEMSWKEYAIALIVFSAFGVLLTYALQRLQIWLPWNPQGQVNVSPDSSFNTAVSFVTNTNWQGYGGESTMSYFTQMVALAVHNFTSAATGIAVAFALIRGLARHSAAGVGNFWTDLYRITTYLLLPISLVFALVLVSQGAIQNLSPYQDAATLEVTQYDNPKNGPDGQPLKDEKGNPVTEPAETKIQTIAMGPVASQEAIKMLGTNGGGFFNANSAHPFENPTPLANFLQMLAIFLIPAGLCYCFGRIVGDTRQGWAVLGAMTAIFVVMAVVAMSSETSVAPQLAKLTSLTNDSGLGNMEGKETRFGVAASALFATITTAASCGAVNAMHDSFMPMGGFVPLFMIQLGEVVFGGVGSGLYGMLVYAIMAVFLAGLMIGRTPEYLGKKIESYEIKMVSISILVVPLLVLTGTAISVLVEPGKAGIANPGAHGFSEILYAFSSAANNNGSAFAGLSANTPYYNVMLAIAMWFGRFAIIVPVLALAGSLAAKKRIPVSGGTMPTHGGLFIVLLVGTVLLVGALTYVPALALGPVVEHVLMKAAP
ncbi:MAG: potassium-transporting ATPase subunit KdpA [Betaproteobacteria bacterium]|nr:potassium-transporting ATPase subunit KdpA [Betaproteobacteria bacterium]